MAETVPASPERLRRARRSGDGPMSGLAVRVAALAAVALVGRSAASALSDRFRALLASGLSRADAADAAALVLEVAALALPFAAVVAALALLAGLAQTGGVVALRRAPRAAPARAPGDGAITALRGVLAGAALLTGSLGVLRASGPDLAAAVGRPEALAGLAHALTGRWLRVILVVGAVLAAADLVVVRARWLARQRPTRWEADRERREHEGDPRLRRERRRAHEALAEAGDGD